MLSLSKNIVDSEMNDSGLKYERYFGDPLFCTFADCLDKAGHGTAFGAVQVWSEALKTLRRLTTSKRPDLLIEGIYSDLCLSSGSEEHAGIVLICVMYMICSKDQVNNRLSIAVRKIAAKIVDHPLLLEIFKNQRIAERFEEENGNPVLADYYQTRGEALLEEPAAPYGSSISLLDEDLRTCIADKDLFDEFVGIINGEIISFIHSPEGSSQLWEVVMAVSKEKNYIARNCKRNKFARNVSAVCPKAGDAKKIDQNMQKYSEINPKKSNDLASIRSRFKVPGK